MGEEGEAEGGWGEEMVLQVDHVQLIGEGQDIAPKE